MTAGHATRQQGRPVFRLLTYNSPPVTMHSLVSTTRRHSCFTHYLPYSPLPVVIIASAYTHKDYNNINEATDDANAIHCNTTAMPHRIAIALTYRHNESAAAYVPGVTNNFQRAQHPYRTQDIRHQHCNSCVKPLLLLQPVLFTYYDEEHHSYLPPTYRHRTPYYYYNDSFVLTVLTTDRILMLQGQKQVL